MLSGMPAIYQYTPRELRLAYVHRIYFRFQTYRRIPLPGLDTLLLDPLASELRRYHIHLLDLAGDDTDIVCQVSLLPDESVASAASKTKGRLSKFLRAALGADDEVKLLAKGYFACTVGDNTHDTVTAYLENQGRHHRYMERPLPPVYVDAFQPVDVTDVRLCAAHSASLLRYHLVLGTCRRRGIFTQAESQHVTRAWQERQAGGMFALLKVSFVPDHVHVAVRVHPRIVPRELIGMPMNAAEQAMAEKFTEIMIGHSAGRLWDNGGYVGSFGDLTSTSVRRAIARWKGGGGRAAGL